MRKRGGLMGCKEVQGGGVDYLQRVANKKLSFISNKSNSDYSRQFTQIKIFDYEKANISFINRPR